MPNSTDHSCLLLFFEHAGDACVHLDPNGKVIDCNRAMLRATGLPREQLVGTPYDSLLVPVDPIPSYDHGIDNALTFRAKLNSSNGSQILCEWRIVGGGEMGSVLIGTDFTDTNSAIADLASAEKRLSAVLETTVDAILTINERATILTVNRAAEEIFQYRASELVGRNVSVLMPEPYRDEHDDYVDRYIETGERRIIGIGREVTGLRKDGSTFPMDLAVSEVNLDDGRIFTGIVRDISQRRELEREILRISEEERRRIGQDLHDELGQMLTGIGLLSQNLTRKLQGEEHPEADNLAQITKLIKEADQYARTLARGLVPVELQARGLSSALLRLAQDATTLFGVDCTFEEHGTVTFADTTKSVHLYRIAQEAISNASKHGRATRLQVDLIGTADHVRLQVRDNGSGFADGWQEKAGMGVNIMNYRAKLIGGSLEIRDRVSGGTMVKCLVPIAATSLMAGH